jgi:hypothetical protein
MICLEPPDDEDIECPQCGGAAEQACKYSVKCTECDWSFENLPDIEPEVSFYDENNLP